jgi:hypothetical protein
LSRTDDYYFDMGGQTFLSVNYNSAKNIFRTTINVNIIDPCYEAHSLKPFSTILIIPVPPVSGGIQGGLDGI